MGHFKIGDEIKNKNTQLFYTITSLYGSVYFLSDFAGTTIAVLDKVLHIDFELVIRSLMFKAGDTVQDADGRIFKIKSLINGNYEVIQDGIIQDTVTFFIPTHALYDCKLISSQNEINKNPKFHTHQWQSYVGFTESYKYCSICDEKSKETE